MTKTTRIGGAALNQTPMDWENNLLNIKNAIARARNEAIEILCLPELCITGYGCEDMFLSEWLPQKAMELLFDVVPYCDNIAVTVGLPVLFRGVLYNTTCMIRNKQALGFYAKQNLANDGVHYEPRWFSAWPVEKVESIETIQGRIPFGDITIQHGAIKIGFEICEDAWREDRPACRLVEKDVQLILNPSASHFAFGKSETRTSLVINSSSMFHCYYLYANLLGNEAGRMIYDGAVLIAGHGKLLASNPLLSFKDFNLTYQDIDVSKMPKTGKQDNIPPKEELFAQATSLALFDYMRKSRNRGFVLSLSGGADSSTCAIMVSEMVRRARKELGDEAFFSRLSYLNIEVSSNTTNQKLVKKLLTTAYQGTVNSSQSTFESARALAEEIGAVFHYWLIDDEVSSYTKKIEKVLEHNLTWQNDDIALQNIQARARSPIIWMLANIQGGLLLTTSNRSEGDVGYATMDGDTSGSLAPISAVDKHFILQFLKYAEHQLGYKSLEHVNNLAPSAELRPQERGQTDEEDLMPYPVIVAIEKLAIKLKKSPLEVYEVLKKENMEPDDILKTHIHRFYTLWSRNQWKRERLAPAFHLDDFNVDPRTWCRFPILSGSFKKELEMLTNA